MSVNTADEEFEPVWVVGFMSGTSLDAVDAAMILTDGETVYDFGPVAERKYEPSERRVLQEAVQAARAWNWQGDEPGAAFAAAEEVLTVCHGDAFDAIIGQWSGPALALVGVHGQTVLHRRPRPGQPGATRQILDATALRQRLGIDVAYDFRSADVAAGGEGAPLAPAYHAALLAGPRKGAKAVLNLGGVANITWVGGPGQLLAFDTGPANGPIDEWIEGHGRGTYDRNGQIAASGRVHEGLINQLLDHPFFGEAPPKSLDRYDFDANLARGLSLEDGAATLTAFSARAVAAGLALCPELPVEVIASGGGRHNPVLMAALSEAMPCPVRTAEDAGWRGDSIEAEAFALLAVRTLRGLPISFPSTTGVPTPQSGGRICRS